MKLVVFLLTVFSVNCWSYDGMPKEQINSFFDDYAKGEYNKAMTKLYVTNERLSEQSQLMSMMQQQMSSVTTLFGGYIGHENVQYEELSPSLVRVVEIAKHERHPIVWEFYFYKPKNKWIVAETTFKDSFKILGAKK